MQGGQMETRPLLWLLPLSSRGRPQSPGAPQPQEGGPFAGAHQQNRTLPCGNQRWWVRQSFHIPFYIPLSF